MEKITAKQARKHTEYVRQKLFEQVVENIYREIKKACYLGRTSLMYNSDCNLPPAWQTVHIFQPLVEELTQNGYSVEEGIVDTGHGQYIQYIEVRWD